MNLVRITWVDATTTLTPVKINKAKSLETHLIESVGFHIDSNKDREVIGFQFNNNLKEFRYITIIPREFVKEIEILKNVVSADKK